jgi:CRISPR-associated protein Csm4
MANKNFHLVKLNFKTPLHLSRGQTDAYDKSEETLHSDTLKSAIFVAAKMLFGDNADEVFFDAFKVSSAFPFAGDEYFFPKPMVKLNIDFKEKGLGESKKSKKLKKLSYISNNIFEKLISGEKIELSESRLSNNGKFLFSDKPGTVFTSEVQQRLSMPVGDEKDGTPYYIERIYFSYNCGMYFFIDYGEDENLRQNLEGALKLLGDEGIGTDKHIGNGIFIPEWKQLSLNLPNNADSHLTLSLYCPEKGELKKDLLEQSSWQLIKRGGYIASPANIDFITFRKKSVYMFSEASVFPASMNIKGKKVNLKPENISELNHPIWRDGNAFVIPIKQNQNA